MKFIHEVLLALSMCLFRWINRIISKRAHAISKIIFILGSKKFLACLERVISYTWSFSHSDPDPSSVSPTICRYIKHDKNDHKLLLLQKIWPLTTLKSIGLCKKNISSTYLFCSSNEPLKTKMADQIYFRVSFHQR